MSRISIEVTPEEHNAIKAMALLEGVNIKEFVVSRVFAEMPKTMGNKPKKPKTPNARVMAALRESVEQSDVLKRYKTAKALFDEYR